MFDFEKFRPKASLKILRSDRLVTPTRHALKVVALSEFVAWVCLGQIGRNKTKPKRPKAKGFIRTESALHARHTTIALLLDRYSKIELEDERVTFLGNYLLASGGLRLLVENRSLGEAFEEFQLMDETLRYVVEIVRYIIRAEKFLKDRKPVIEDAKAFVEGSCRKLHLKHIGSSAISKIWEDFKPAAPYIYALYSERCFKPSKAESVDKIIDWLNTFTSRQSRIDLFLGRAASAMDVLSNASRNQRTGDLKDIARIDLKCYAFDSSELEVISKIDRDKPIKSKLYRPKRLAKTSVS